VTGSKGRPAGVQAARQRVAPGGTQEGLRRHNLGTLLAHLHLAGPLSRAELTARMGLNRSTIAGLVSELAALDAVREERPAGVQASAGRPSLVVQPRSDTVQAVAADVGVRQVTVALAGLGGDVVTRRQRQVTEPTPEAVAELLASLVRTLLSDPAAGRHIVGAGVSIPGIVRQRDGCVRFAPNLGWTDAPFGELVQRRLEGMRVHVGNDADLGALAEYRRGAARGVDNVVFISCEVGVGGGLILDGRSLRGAGGYAGELGHMTVRPGGRPCRCGARGCWETEVGAAAIAQALGMPDASMDDLVAAVRSAPGGRGSALAEIAGWVGVGVANVVNLVNPQLVILGGLLEDVFVAAETSVRASLSAAALSAPAEQLRLQVPELGADTVLAGAAELAWEDLLADPAGVLRRPGHRVSDPPRT
jgi:predicted NBD/HSP70 family sugar kinase